MLQRQEPQQQLLGTLSLCLSCFMFRDSFASPFSHYPICHCSISSFSHFLVLPFTPSVHHPPLLRQFYGGFASSAVNFHAADGSGYKFLADGIIKLDGINHQVAARLVSPFTAYKRYDAARQGLMKAELERNLAVKTLSPNVYEIVSKSIK